MKNLYETSAVAIGGRDGTVAVEGSPLSFEMALPAGMGGKKGEGANPEQLFAAGFSACFGGSLQFVLLSRRLKVTPPEVRATVGIGRNDQNKLDIHVALQVTFRDIDEATAQEVLEEAHQVCPYSRATRGNIEVTLSKIVL